MPLHARAKIPRAPHLLCPYPHSKQSFIQLQRLLHAPPSITRRRKRSQHRKLIPTTKSLTQPAARSQVCLQLTAISQTPTRRTTCGQSATTTMSGTLSRLMVKNISGRTWHEPIRAQRRRSICLAVCKGSMPNRSTTTNTLYVYLPPLLLLLILQTRIPARQVPRPKNTAVVNRRCLSPQDVPARQVSAYCLVQ